ncbi:response regulator [Spirosoma horti]
MATQTRHRKLPRTPILIIENNPDQWLIIRSVLAQCFPHVAPIWKQHAPDVLAYLDSTGNKRLSRPQLIIVEPNLPAQEDGWALIKQIKAQPAYQDIPVIILSHSEKAQDIAYAYGFGIAAYITRPTTVQQWLACFTALRRHWGEVVHLPNPL